MPGRPPIVVSASKRTDIPAFYLKWLIGRVAAGWVDVPNPLFRHKVTRVSLQPADVAWIVFWSKNYAVFCRQAAAFDAYRLFFQFTINPPSALLEPDLPPTAQALAQMAFLAARYGPERVVWRYDPVTVWREGGHERSNYDPAWFAATARRVAALGISQVVTSFADPYRKVLRRIQRRHPGLELLDPPDATRQAWVAELREIAIGYGIALESCAEPAIEGILGRGSCIDGRRLTQLGGAPVSRALASDSQVAHRAACGCTRHVDIGDYLAQECGYRCLYCYAKP